MVRGSENLENFKLRAVAAAAGQTFIDVGGRSRQAEAAGVDESLIASWWCATYFFARITAFFTGDAVGCQKSRYAILSLRGSTELISGEQREATPLSTA